MESARNAEPHEIGSGVDTCG